MINKPSARFYIVCGSTYKRRTGKERSFVQAVASYFMSQVFAFRAVILGPSFNITICYVYFLFRF